MKRALLLSSGAMRGVFYAGVIRELKRQRFGFDLVVGVSAGALAGAWMAAGMEDYCLDSWRLSADFRASLHPALNFGRRVNIDRLIRLNTLRHLSLYRLRRSPITVKLAASRWEGFGNGRPFWTRRMFIAQEAASDEELAQYIRATAYMPVVNGFTGGVKIDGRYYVDGGVTSRFPLAEIPAADYDEIWVSACSPSGLQEMRTALKAYPHQEKIVVIAPERPVPIGRLEMNWEKFRLVAQMGEEATARAIVNYRQSIKNQRTLKGFILSF